LTKEYDTVNFQCLLPVSGLVISCGRAKGVKFRSCLHFGLWLAREIIGDYYVKEISVYFWK